MQIKDIFAKPIDRDIQGVIIVGQDENANAKQELEEYVVTKELQKHFADFFSAYKKGIIATTPKMGVWISGFFGSGKSHFLKILSYVLENRKVAGKFAIDYFKEDKKIIDPIVLADMQLAADTSTDVVLFNIDSKSDSNGKQDKDAIVHVFLKVFNEMQGFCGAMPFLADLERRMTEENRFVEFKQKFVAEYGEIWEDSRQDFDFIQDTIVHILVDMNFMSEDAARNWCEKATQPYQISIEEFAKRVKQYIEKKGNNHHVVFLVDEVGQYIGDDSKLMLNMQTVTEELGKECNGKAWVIVTSQQDIDTITKVKGDDFSKIQGRFDTRLSLSSANADAVIKKRILEKNDTAAQTLRLRYGQENTIIKNLIVFNDPVEKKLYADENDFSVVYPFVPYQFNLLAGVLNSVRIHGASGKHLSEGERSMLAMFKESAVEYKEQAIGSIIPFYAFYDAMENFLDHSHRGVIQKAYDNGQVNPERKEKDVFAVNVLKTLFMIKYCNDICHANLDNITSLMISNIEEDRIALRAKVEEALKVLMRQMYIQKNGDIYIFLTNEEQEINREIDNQNVEMADVINKVSEMIFEDIFTDKKYRYPVFNGRYAFSFNQKIDEYLYKSNQNYDIGVHVLTPASEYSTDDAMLRMLSGQQKEVLVVLPDNHIFMDEIQRCLKIARYLRSNASSSLSTYENIKEAKNSEMRERGSNAKASLTEALENAAIYINGDRAQINSKAITGRINDALEKLVTAVYHKLSYIDTPMDESKIHHMMRSSDHAMTLELDSSKEANELALNDVLQFISGNTKNHCRTSMKTIKDRFMKAPYGFVEDDVDWLIARLFKRGDIAFTMNGASVTFINKSADEIVNLITKKTFVEKLLMERRIKVLEKDKKTVQDIMKELFHYSNGSGNEDDIMNCFIKYSQKLLQNVKEINIRYEGNAYPGQKVIRQGIQLLNDVEQTQSTQEFFRFVVAKQDDLHDFAEDFEPVQAFFEGEQKKIFDLALRQMHIYEDSKVYIVDQPLENVVGDIQQILRMENPYREIPKLPELLEQFGTIYMKILDKKQAPVLTTITDDCNRVFDVLRTKTYKDQKNESYRKQFTDLRDKAEHCNNVSTLRSYADQSDALKIRLLDEMRDIDKKTAEKKKAAEQQEKNRKTTPDVAEAPAVPYSVKKIKNVSIKTVTCTSSWRLTSAEDVDTCIEDLKKRLLEELDTDTIINIEF
jgi:uncharacterized protein (UPF0335 family)